MKRIIPLVLVVFFVHSTFLCYAQDDDVPLPKSLRNYTPRDLEKKRKVKIMAGGTLGAQFGPYTAVSVSPMFGVYPTDWLLIGINASYMYSYEGYYKLSSHVFGASIFAQGLIWKQRIIAHAGYEYVNYDLFYIINNSVIEKERRSSHSLILGPGYRQPVGGGANLYFLILFDVIRNEYSFYSNPIIRIGFTFDF